MKNVPEKSKITIPAKDSIYIHIYVHKDTKKLFQKLFNAWQTQQIDNGSKEKSRNFFILEALNCLKNSRGIVLKE